MAIAPFRNCAAGRRGCRLPGSPHRQGQRRHDPQPPLRVPPPAAAGSPLARCSRPGERRQPPTPPTPATAPGSSSGKTAPGPRSEASERLPGATRGAGRRNGTGRASRRQTSPPGGRQALYSAPPPPAPRQPRAGLPAAAPVSLRIAPPRCGTEDAQPATNGRRGKGRGEKRRRAAGQGPPGAHPGQGWAGLAASPGRRLPLAESRPTRPSAPRHVTGVTPPAPPAPSAARTFPLPPRLTAGPLTRAEGNRAAPACAAGRRLRSLRPRLPLPPGPPNFLAGNSR